MYKTDKGERKFSFTRFLSNAAPPLAGPPQDTRLSPHEQDLLFTYQLSLDDPCVLGPQAFLHAGITSAPKISASIHKALLSNGVLAQDLPSVNTNAISRNFAHELSSITSHAQKKVVDLLFFWEEEVQRWKVLMGEQEELKIVIAEEKESGGNVGTFEKRLVEVEGTMRLRPSLRGAQARGEERLPGYEGR